ncbi:MAG: antiporter, partial [Candidatus Neomarinimicrobiota bacterium]
ILVPLVMTFALLGGLSGDSSVLQNTSGTLIGKIPAGTEAWIQNAGFVWLLLLIPLAFAGWFGMNNLITGAISPDLGSPLNAFAKILYLLLIGFATAAIGLYFILPAPTGIEAGNWFTDNILKNKWIILPIIIAATVFLMKKLSPGSLKENLARQYRIFNNKHTWAMTIIYTMTFGSFIGYSAAFPLAIKVIFGFTHVAGPDGNLVHTTVNPNGPSALMFAWIGPFIGALIRPVGGWIADKVGGAKVTQIVSVVMIASALGVAYYMSAAFRSATPEIYFVPFLILFIILFTATGVGNGSTFRTIAVIFDNEQAGPVLGWTSAVAAYGAFIIPKVFGEQIKATTPEYTLFGFAIFYVICLMLNWWFYLRSNAYIKNP